MKLKDILFESSFGDPSFEELEKKERDKILDNIDKFLKTGEFIFKEPYLYRGRTFDGFVKEKNTESYDLPREPVDTGMEEDYIIHDYSVNCYPEHPDRRQARFATTSSDLAHDYGPNLYVIFPHKKAKISSNVEDAFQIFMDNQSYLENALKDFYTFGSGGGVFKRGSFRDNEDEIDNDIQQLIEKLYKIYQMDASKKPSLYEHGCPKQVLHKLVDHEKKFERKDKFLEEGFRNLKDYYSDLVLEYFTSYDLGYPEDKNSGGGEVVYQGKYLQVKYQAMNAYIKQRMN